MKLQNRLLGSAAFLILAITSARAVPFTPSFADYPFPGSQFTVDAAANTFYSTNYGITISNAYLYKDSRDTFDGVGVSAGTVAEIGTTQTGRIDFLDTTNFVNFDYWTILGTTYQALDGDGNVIDTLTLGGGLLGNWTFTTTGEISALIWTSSGGFGQVTGLRYDYDGTTDGHNTDTHPGVPDSASTGLLLALGAGALALARLRRS